LIDAALSGAIADDATCWTDRLFNLSVPAVVPECRRRC